MASQSNHHVPGALGDDGRVAVKQVVSACQGHKEKTLMFAFAFSPSFQRTMVMTQVQAGMPGKNTFGIHGGAFAVELVGCAGGPLE